VLIQADSDERLLQLWLHAKSPRTQRAYRADIRRCLPLPQLILGDIQAYKDSLSELAVASNFTRVGYCGLARISVSIAASFGSIRETIPITVAMSARRAAISARSCSCCWASRDRTAASDMASHHGAPSS
jgi:hypothetical protein